MIASGYCLPLPQLRSSNGGNVAAEQGSTPLMRSRVVSGGCTLNRRRVERKRERKGFSQLPDPVPGRCQLVRSKVSRGPNGHPVGVRGKSTPSRERSSRVGSYSCLPRSQSDPPIGESISVGTGPSDGRPGSGGASDTGEPRPCSRRSRISHRASSRVERQRVSKHERNEGIPPPQPYPECRAGRGTRQQDTI